MALASGLAYWGWRRWRSGSSDGGRSDGGASSASRERGHEPEGSENVRLMAVAGVGLLVSVVIVLFLVVGFMNMLGGAFAEDAVPFEGAQNEPPGPRLQEDPAIDLQAMHERENERLLHYGWISKKQNRAHIPIERAMTLIAERGLPTRDTSAYRDSVRVPTESGFRIIRRGPLVGQPPAYLGSSPEPYTTTPDFREYLNEEQYLREE